MLASKLARALVAAVLFAACSGSGTQTRRPNTGDGVDTGGSAGSDTTGGTGGTGGSGGSGGSQTPDAGPAPLKAKGSACSTGNQCQNGLCVDGFCCNTTCTGLCNSCKLPGSEGTCTPVAAGDDPDDECPDDGAASCKRDGTCDGNGACRKYPSGTECKPGGCVGSTESSAQVCDGSGVCQPGTSMACPTACVAGACNRTCSDANPCQVGFFCDATGMCKLKVQMGQACAMDAECATGACADGVCCQTPCNQLCYSCKLPGSIGVCAPAPDGMDPKGQCPAQAATTCGNAGGCNGAGACRIQPAGTPCGNQTCSVITETDARTCNGTGSCVAGTVIDCSPFRCGGNACRTTCRTVSDCDLGFICTAGQCTGDGLAGLVLHWRFDETTGTMAVDTSGAGHIGTYVGTTGTPTPSTLVPQIGETNARSRAFLRANRQAVQLASMPVDLEPTDQLTVAAWYRAISVDTSGATLVSAGNNYLIRLRPTQIEFAKRTTTGQGTTRLGAVLATVPGMLNGSWHHVAGVTSPTEGMKLYVDGVLVKADTTITQNVLYDQGQDLWVGRDGNGSASWDFEGNIDDVRIYNQALAADDVATLVHPNRPEVILHWRFDETSGTIASDDSGNGFDGTYTGTTGTPTASTLVPAVAFDDPRSRKFVRANRHAVRLANMSPVMQPPNDITLSAWYRAIAPLDTAGADVASAGNSYLLRLLPTRVEFSKRYTNAAGVGATAILDSPNLANNAHLDGKWHHLAATSNAAGMKLYYDGVEVGTNTRGEDIRYDQGRDFWVGRDGNNQATYDFEGNIDDVFVHGRALSAAEIADLAQQQGTGAPELALDWAFDETSGTTANDSSPGAADDGTYVAGPMASTDLPTVPFADLRSRLFDRTMRQAVQLVPMPQNLQPANDLTVSVWYKAGQPLAGNMTGEELVSAGDNYLLRLRATQVEFSKRTTGGIQICLAPVGAAKIFDGGWHHVAATTSTDQIRIYFDGVAQTCPTTGTDGDIVYTAGQNFYVGRHGNNQTTWDFDGNIDEVRIYRRALAADEIAALAQQITKPVPVLQWLFDETAGTMANDSSANNLDGTYVGTPLSDPAVRNGAVGDPASLKFDGSMRQAVTRAPIPAQVKLANNVSISAWYRATTTDTGGAEIVSAGNSYLLRLRPTQVEFSKQTAAGTKQCLATASMFLDGGWHHLVGLSSATDGMQVWFDGTLICNDGASTQDIIYTAAGEGPDFWVGRHGNGQDQWDFTGNLDDVRIYNQVLTSDQVNAIFHNSF